MSMTDTNSNINKFNFQNEKHTLKIYLRSIFEDLTSRKLLKNKREVFLTIEVFKEFMNLPSLVSNSLFRILDTKHKCKLTIDDFVEGLTQILTANKENYLTFLFTLCDFDGDGYIYIQDLNLVNFYMHYFSNKQEKYSFSEISILNKDYTISNLEGKSLIHEETFLLIFCNDKIIENLFNSILCGIPIKKESLNIISTHQTNQNHKLIKKRSLRDVYFKYDINCLENENISNFTFRNEENQIYSDNIGSENEEVTKTIILPCLKSIRKLSCLSTNPDSLDSSPKVIDIDFIRDFSPLKLSKDSPMKIKVKYEEFSPLDFLNKYSLNEKSKESSGKTFNLCPSIDPQINNQKIYKYESFLFKRTKSNKLKKIWLVLLNKDLFYFNSEKTKFKGLHNLTSCYYFEPLFNTPFKGFFGFQITFKNKQRTYYCESYEEVDRWLNILEKVTNYRNIHDHYEIGKLLGTGEFAEVRLAHDHESNTTNAVKIINKLKLNPPELDIIRNEIEVLAICNNENIVKLVDKFESPEKIYLVLEYIEGTTLKKLIQSPPSNLDEDKLKEIILKIAEAINYLSMLGILHRDLKPENIMVTQDLQIKIIDFGLSKIIGKGEKVREKLGSYLYTAPEVLSNLQYNKEVDIWSFGIIIFFMLTCELPYYDPLLMLKLIQKENFDFIFDNQSFKILSLEAQDLIKNCLSYQSNRIDISNIISHSWFEK